MQIDFYAAADVAAIGVELTNQQADLVADNEPVVAADDNVLRWPLIPFHEVGMRPRELSITQNLDRSS
jgi:hypothetical protein